RRLPVPPLSSPIGTSVPTSAEPTIRTVPSPPSAQTRSTPSASACLVCPYPGSSIVVSNQRGSAQPCLRQMASSSERIRAVPAVPWNLVGLTTMAARSRPSIRVCSEMAGAVSVPPPDGACPPLLSDPSAIAYTVPNLQPTAAASALSRLSTTQTSRS